MYENVINQLKFYIQQKETTMQLTVGRMVAPALKKEINTLRSAVEAIEALVAGQETLKQSIQKDMRQDVVGFVNALKKDAKNKSEITDVNGRPLPGFGVYEITDQNFTDCFNLFFKDGDNNE